MWYYGLTIRFKYRGRSVKGMQPIVNGVTLYLNIPRPVALEREIDEDTDFVLFDYPDRLVFVKKESLVNATRSAEPHPTSV